MIKLGDTYALFSLKFCGSVVLCPGTKSAVVEPIKGGEGRQLSVQGLPDSSSLSAV